MFSTPSFLMSSVVNTVTPEYFKFSASALSRLLAPTITAFAGWIISPLWNNLKSSHSYPVIAASGRPWMLPVIVVLNVSYLILCNIIGLAVNSKFYRFDWTEEREIFKNSASVLISTLVGSSSLKYILRIL